MTSGTIFDVQHYAVHDGPGIRTLVFLKGCPLRCAWCCNPESQQSARQLRHLASRCQKCLRCEQVCTLGAVSRLGDRPRFDRARCERCDDAPCVDGCVHDALGLVGERMEVAEVVERVAADVAFYRNSGGGVTFSGGEPFAQPEFLLELLSACRARGIHTAVETCGCASREAFEKALPLVDLFLFDLKIVDPSRHRALTGAGNELILENLRFVAKASKGLTLRVPLVPGCTDSDENLEAIARLAVELKVASVSLQPYHPLGTLKGEQIGRAPALEIEPPSPEAIDRAARLFERHGIRCEPA